MDSLIKPRDFPGGIYPPENKNQSTSLPLGKVPLPPQLIIPLNQHMGSPAKPIVAVGEKVRAGQLIAVTDGVFSANVHASSSGVVTAIADHAIPHPSGIGAACIFIATDGKHEPTTYDTCEDYTQLDSLTLIEKIRAAGIAGLGGAGFPTAVKLSTKSTQVIDTLIINGAECEPYITADDMLMQTRAADVIAGTFLLSHILGNPAQLLIAIEDNKPNAIAALHQALKKFSLPDVKHSINIVAIPTKYPSGGAKQLTQILTGREIPHGHHSADVGVLCLNVGTVAAAWRAVRFGEPLISRITTLTGEALKIQRNCEVLIGTSIDYLLAHHGFDADKALRVIVGGSLMGFTLPVLTAPVTKTTNCLLAASKKELPPPPPAQACIRCGLCSEVCPASLLPQQLFWYAQAEDTERLEAHHLFDCIECGACSYVCPSKIPLVQYYRAAKGMIQQQQKDKEKADRSRQRFEFRQERFAKAEALKEERRIARQKAAEEARKQLAEKKLAQAKSPDTAEVDQNLIVAAVAKANSGQADFDEQCARLERIVSAAKISLTNAQEPLDERNPAAPITDEKRIKQQARIKQAERKLAEAEKRLTEFLAGANAEPLSKVAATLARVQEKINQTPEEKLRANLESLRTRLASAQQRADQANAESSPIATALQKGADNIRLKISQVETELANLHKMPGKASPATTIDTTEALKNAAEKATARASMSETEKRDHEIQTLKLRLKKAQERLENAETSGETNTAILKIAVEKLEQKLQELG